jgi:hypothetical protein
MSNAKAEEFLPEDIKRFRKNLHKYQPCDTCGVHMLGIVQGLKHPPRRICDCCYEGSEDE